jgi:3-oxoacyl-[acyl-carrier protein] reductase
MDLQLEGRIVLIAGASKGIGLAIAEACLAEGAKVGLTGRTKDVLERSRLRLANRYGEGNVTSFVGDMRDSEVIEAAIVHTEQTLGPLWGTVANVGLGGTPILGLEMTDEIWLEGFDQNTHSAYYLARSALKRMVGRGEGAFIFMGSIAGIASIGAPLNYSVAKAGINLLTKGLAALVGSSGVRVNAVAPGNVLFEGSRWEARLNADGGEAWESWVKKEVPLQRFGRPEEVADMAVFLLSPRSSFTHGAIVVVDGGQTK